MGFWSKLGKIALTAAPYIAAPFTGGASLAYAPLANSAAGAWSAYDAKKNAEKGLGPSSFDRYLGMAGNVASLGASTGAFGKTPAVGSTASKVANTANAASGIFNRIPSNQSVQTNQSVQREPSQQTYDDMTSSPIGPSAIPTAGTMPQGGFNWNQNPMNQFNQSSPNIASSIFQGREEAIMNQPWRSGYQVNTQGPDESVITTEMPEMFPNSQRRRPA